MVGPLVLEGPGESLGDGVIVALAGAAHRALDAQGLQGLLVSVARVLAAAVAVVEQLLADRLPHFDRLPESCGNEFGRLQSESRLVP